MKQPLSEFSQWLPVWALLSPQLVKIFSVHSLLHLVLYGDWFNTDKVFSPPRHFAKQYPLKALPIVDSTIICLHKTLTVPVEDILVFKNLVDK